MENESFLSEKNIRRNLEPIYNFDGLWKIFFRTRPTLKFAGSVIWNLRILSTSPDTVAAKKR